MRKLTLLLALLAIAALPSTADAAQKKRVAAQQQQAAQPENPNANTARFLRDAFPVFLPSWAIPIYLSQQTEGPHAYNGAKRKDAKQVKQAKRAQ